MEAALFLKQQRGLDVVGLDAADIVGFLVGVGGGSVLTTANGEAWTRGARCCLITLLARFSTSEIMEFLKSVAAVRGRLVTSVMLSLPSGHMTFITGLELDAEADFSLKPEGVFNTRVCVCVCVTCCTRVS